MKTITPINKLGDWKLILPLNYEDFRNTLKPFIGDADRTRILIVDDIDFDGFGSAKICKSKLSKIFPKCDIYINDQHGFYDLKKGASYDIVFILDSSSNLVETYKDLKQVFVLDHHEYDKNLICPSNVCFINSNDTPGLESISAGMLTYIVLTQFLYDAGIEDTSLFDIACMTLYSDIVPLDDYVQSCLLHLMTHTEYSNLTTSLNIYKDAINKNTISYTIVPLVNYTRRLGDKNTLNLLYSTNEDLAVRKLLENRETCKNILQMIDKMGNPGFMDEEFENFIYYDISYLVDNIPTLPINMFKGVYANQLSERKGKPVLVGFTIGEEVYFSVRSNGINSLDFFTEYNLSGGGHKPACGFSGLVYELPSILRDYDEYVVGAKIIEDTVIEINSLDDLSRFDLQRLAIYNEFKFSNFKPSKILLKEVDTKMMTNIDLVRYHFSLENHKFISYKEIVTEGYVDIEIVPTLASYLLESKKLIATVTKNTQGGK